MKKFYLFLFFVIVVFGNAYSQVPDAFNYQAVVRDVSGSVLANQSVTFRISILQDSESGTVVYSETHATTTNAFGLANLIIGEGTPVSGTFGPANWSSTPHFIKIEIDPAGGTSFSALGTSKLLSVPYAFAAESVVNDKVNDADADSTNELQSISLSGTVLTLSDGGGSVNLPSTGSGGDNWGTQTVETDGTITGNGTTANPLSVVGDLTDDQTLSLSGNDLTISDGNTVTLPSGGTSYTAGTGISISGNTITNTGDADADSTNELQSISLSGTVLTLSDGGGSVTLPSTGSGGDNWGTQTVETDGTITGNGTTANPLSVVGDLTDDQTLSLSGNDLTISDGNTVTLPSGGSSYTAGTGISISGNTITNTGDTDASDDVREINDLSDAKYTGSSLFLGEGAGASDDGGVNNFNVAIGKEALKTNQTGDANTAVGYQTLSKTTAASNTAFGYQALYNDIRGYANTAIGMFAQYHNDRGNNNVALGAQSLMNNTNGSNNVALGYSAGYNATGAGNIFIGMNSGYNETGNNKLYIENSNSDTPLIGGDFSTDEVTINGSLAIKDGTQGDGKVLTSDANGVASWETPAAGGSSLWTENVSNISRNGAVGINSDWDNGFALTVNQGAYPATLLLESDNDVAMRITRQAKNNSSRLLFTTEEGVADGFEITQPSNSDNFQIKPNNYSSNGLEMDPTGNVDFKNNVTIAGTLKVEGGAPGAGKVLTSDANGLASWETPAAGGSSLWTQSGSNIYYNSGKVGIGTSSPGYDLDIQNSTSATFVNIKSTTDNAILTLDRSSVHSFGQIIYATNGAADNRMYAGFLSNSENYSISTSYSSLSGLEVQKTTGKVATSGDLSVGNNLDVGGDAFMNQNLEVSDDLTVGSVTVSAGEIYTTTSGVSNNLLPFAYGNVASNGTLDSGTSNVGTVSKGSTGEYTIEISGLGSAYVVQVTGIVDRPYFLVNVSGKYTTNFTVTAWDAQYDAPVDCAFSFVIFKP